MLPSGFREYRVSCFLGSAIRVVHKAGENDWRTINNPFTKCVEISLAAVKTLGLDYGAVDIVLENPDAATKKFTVLEVNTAPEVDGPDMPVWINAFRKLEEFEKAKDALAGARLAFPYLRDESRAERAA
jgi:glutathione synthase/RimK-type ligase-like ATP-grasp enzyme